MMDPKHLERLAYHEAGHAVMAWLFGLGVSEAMIGESGGRVRHEQAGALQDALIGAAGYAAEILFIGEPWWPGMHSDARMLSDAANQEPKLTGEVMRRYSHDYAAFADLGEQERLFGAFCMLAEEVLAHHRPEIAELALALAECGKIEEVSFWLGFRSPHAGRLVLPPPKSERHKPPASEVIAWLTRPPN